MQGRNAPMKTSETKTWRAPSNNSTLISLNVTVGRRRTSLRLEQAMWDAVAEICWREALSVGKLCHLVDETRIESTLTAALRVFVLNYFKAAATEEGHASAGHGTFGKRSGSRIE